MARTLGGVLKTLKARARREGQSEAFNALEGHFRGVAQQLEILHHAEVSQILPGKTPTDG